MQNMNDLFAEINKLNEQEIRIAEIAIKGRMQLMKNRRFIAATETYLSLGEKVTFVERDPDGLHRREGVVIGYTATCVKVQVDRENRESLGMEIVSVPWHELSSRI